jgi:hypothetical protein
MKGFQMISRLFYGLLILLIFTSCGSKDDGGDSGGSGTSDKENNEGDDDGDGTSEGEGKILVGEDGKKIEGLEASLLNIPEVLPPVAENSPQAMKLNISSSLTEYAIDCSANASYTACGGNNACIFMEDVKCRFFGTSGPTQISQILGNVDEAMASIKPKEDQYLPCLDPEGNKDGMKDGDTDIAKYAEVTIDTNFTGLKDKDGADYTLDLDYSYKLNCLTGDDGSGWGGFGVAKNDDDKTVYTFADFGGKDGDRNGGLGTIDEDENVEYWGIVSESADTTAELNGSNALIHLKSEASSGIIELSFSGSEVGPDCGMRLITNGNHLFAEANMNVATECESGDTNHNSGLANQVFCIDVSGTNPNSEASNTACTAAGLDSSAFTVDAISGATVLPHEINLLFQKPDGVPDYKAITLDDGGGEEKN